MKNCINTDGNTREWENDDIFKDVNQEQVISGGKSITRCENHL